MRIEDIRQAIELGNIRISDHADEEMAADGFLLDEVLEATKLGEIIENYPSDYPLASCLVLDTTQQETHSTLFGHIMREVAGLCW